MRSAEEKYAGCRRKGDHVKGFGRYYHEKRKAYYLRLCNNQMEAILLITEEFKRSLAKYIAKNHIEDAGNAPDYTLDNGAVKDAGITFSKKESFTLEQLMEEVGESFHEMLFVKIDMSGMTDVEVYKRANIDRKLFSKIRSNPGYHPRKQTVLALAIALKLNIDETVDLLARAEYALSPGNKGDLIVKYFIERGVYDIMTINFTLDEYGQTVLG